MNISQICTAIVAHLSALPGIEAIVLGGSRATGTASETSDIDIGIYYSGTFNSDAFRRAASDLDDAHRADCATNVGDWGPWINGGGWLTINGTPVDLLLRDIDNVERCVRNCIAGNITIDYQCGHPFGFVNSIYMGEAYHCKILWSRGERIARIKDMLATFPSKYKRSAIDRFLWECGFSQQCGKKAIAKGDVVYAAGSLFRSAICLIYAAYAANEMYFLNEKGSLKRIAMQNGVHLPERFKPVLEEAFAALSTDSLDSAFNKIDEIYAVESEMYKSI